MESVLAKVFAEKLYAQVDALQINYIQLPTTFQDAILESISTKQNITQSRRYKDNMQVQPASVFNSSIQEERAGRLWKPRRRTHTPPMAYDPPSPATC
eukprot:scaffold131153_cov66-Phaeocystis_antarctica.AAC.1